MGKKDVHNGMASGISILGLYFKSAADNLGQEKALDLYEKVGESFGAGNAQSWKEKFQGRTPTTKELRDTLSSMYKGMGFEFSIRAGKQKVTNKISRCPFYDGLALAGLDHETIHSMCVRASRGEERALKAAFPELDVFAEPRGYPDGVCIEGDKIKS